MDDRYETLQFSAAMVSGSRHWFRNFLFFRYVGDVSLVQCTQFLFEVFEVNLRPEARYIRRAAFGGVTDGKDENYPNNVR